MGPGVNNLPAAISSPLHGAAPAAVTYDIIRNLYVKMTGKKVDPEKFRAMLDAAMKEDSDGETKLTRAELRKLFDLAFFSKSAFNAFIGGEKALVFSEQEKSHPKALAECMQRYIDYMETTGTPFAYFASAQVDVVNASDLAEVIRGMDDGEILAMATKHQAEVGQTMDYLMKQAELKEAAPKEIVEALKQLIVDAKNGSQDDMEKLEMLSFLLFRDLYENITKEARMALRVDLRDRLVTRHFMQEIYKPYLTKGVEGEKKAVIQATIHAAQKYGQRIKALRAFVGPDNIRGVDIDKIDPNSKDFKDIMTDFTDRKNAEQGEPFQQWLTQRDGFDPAKGSAIEQYTAKSKLERDKEFRAWLRERLEKAGKEEAAPAIGAIYLPPDGHALHVRQQAAQASLLSLP